MSTIYQNTVTFKAIPKTDLAFVFYIIIGGFAGCAALWLSIYFGAIKNNTTKTEESEDDATSTQFASPEYQNSINSHHEPLLSTAELNQDNMF